MIYTIDRSNDAGRVSEVGDRNKLLAKIIKDAQGGDQAAIDAVNEQAQRGGAVGEQAREAQKTLPPAAESGV